MSRLSGETWNGSSEGEGVLAIAESVLEKEERSRKERRRKKKKEEKENHKKGEREKGRRKLFLHCFQILVDQELVLHTSRCENFFLPSYFLVWGHGNGISLSRFVIS